MLADAGADGVVSVGMDNTIASRAQVRIERFLIGMQDLGSGPPELVPPAPGGRIGPAVLDNAYAVEVADEFNVAAGSSAAATVGASVDLKFRSAGDGDDALTSLGIAPSPQATATERRNPTIADAAALQKLSARAVPDPAIGSWSLTAGDPPRKVTFAVVYSSAGSFFCNDLAYREQRAGMPSVFIHVARDEPKPQPTPADSHAVRDAIVEHVKHGVTALARVVVRHR